MHGGPEDNGSIPGSGQNTPIPHPEDVAEDPGSDLLSTRRRKRRLSSDSSISSNSPNSVDTRTPMKVSRVREEEMLSLLQTRLTREWAPFLRTLAALYNGITGQGRPPPPNDVPSPRPDAGYVGCKRLARGRGFARRRLLIGFYRRQLPFNQLFLTVTFNRFKVLQWNCRSITVHLDHLVQHVSRHRVEELCLQSLNCRRKRLSRLEGYSPVLGPVSPAGKVMVRIYIRHNVRFSASPNDTGPTSGYSCGVRVRVQWQPDCTILSCYTPETCTSFDWLK